MILSLRACTCLALLLAALPVTRAVTAEEAKAGRELVKQYAGAIVSVEAVATIKITIGEHAQPPRDNKMEQNGTVISASGLTVVPLSAIDPHGALEGMLSSRGQKADIADTEFKDVKLRLANNVEVPAVIVLKDPDLDLAFLAPLPDAAHPARTFPYVDLTKAVKGELLANYFFVTRAIKALQRVPVVHTSTIIGVVEKPRRMYILSEHPVGVPIFDATGQVLGLSSPYLENGRPVAQVVLAAEDVAELAAQAAAIKPEDKEPKPAAAPGGATPTAAPAAASAGKS